MNDDFHSALVDCSIMHHGFHHGGTYHAHPVAAAVALETLKIYEDERIVDHVRDISEHWIKMISKLAAHELVRSTRTIGLLSAIEVGFRSYRELDFRNDEKRDIKRSVMKACMEHGVLIRISHDSIILAPPLIISKKDIDELEQRMTKAFNTILFS
ncbi:aminotransferase class III-fold pyridoxal phosphate-dependent enzyme, partial [Acetobacter pasteurianus]